MTSGVSIEYAHARASARLGQRPDERLWQQLRASRRLPALLDAVRASPAAPYVSGIDPRASVDGVEHAFRQQFRLRVDEMVQWAPDGWKAAIGWVRLLVDLPALAHLATDAPPWPWMRHDADLAPYVLPTSAERRAALAAGAPAPIAQALGEAAAATARTRPRLHPALVAWREHWTTLWPETPTEERASLEALVQIVERHLQDFGGLQADEAPDARAALAARLTGLMRRGAAQPAALFAWLALLALDLERLRAEFVERAVDQAGAL